VRVLTLDRLEAVGAPAWQALVDRAQARSPFVSWVWQREWVRAFARDARLEIHRVDDDAGDLVALLPLHEAEPGLLRLIGGVDVSDYLDLIAVTGREATAWEALLGARASARAIWDLHAVPAASATVTLLPELAPRFGLAASAVLEERCPVLELPKTWDDYLAGLSGKARHELLRKMRRVEREAPGTHPVGLHRPEDVAGRLDDFLDLHRRSRTGKARFMDARMEGFFRQVAVALAGVGGVRLWFLEGLEGPLASFLCLEWEETVGLYNSGFHPDRAALSPGLVLLAHVIRDAIERGRRRFDFLRGEERYKYEFGPRPEDLYTVTIGPRRP
jgi:CelD/BcsL family acetyltransferase involved in cellulose biosynthesis